MMVIGVAMIPILLIVAIAAATYTGKTVNGVKETTKNGVTESITSLGRIGTWVSRVQDFMYAKDEEVPYQVQQANIAIANGSMLYGLGPGKSRQRNFLPQAYNDEIFPSS
jgi:cell division protein FtsW